MIEDGLGNVLALGWWGLCWVRKAFEAAWYEFQAAYREAAEKLKRGSVDVVFPAGCFPPRLPYTGARAGPPGGAAILGPSY